MTAWAPPRPAPQPRSERLRAPTVTIAGLALLTLALRLRDPHVGGSWGLCPSAALGFWCPGCGGLRAVNDLTHGDVVAAASSNLLLVLLAPAAVVLLARWWVRRWRGVPARDGGPVVAASVAVAVAAIVFMVLRNTALVPWLAP